MNIIPFEQKSVTVSADVAKLFETVIASSAPPHVSIKGKVFTVVKDGVETILSDEEGNPVQILKAVILNQTMTKDGRPTRCRAYFAKAYDGTNQAPACYSNDGIKPSARSTDVQSLTCETCPQAVKGSKRTEKGTMTSACATAKQLAIVPSGDMDYDVMSMRLPITSLWSENEPFKDKNWYSFDGYMKFLRANNVLNPAMVETSVRFYPSAEYPQLLFKATGRLGDDALRKVAARRAEPEVMDIIGLNEPYAEALGGGNADAATDAPIASLPVVEAPKPKASKPKIDLDDLDEAPAPAKAKPAPVKAKPAPAPAPVDEPVDESNLLDKLGQWDDE